MPAFRGNQTFQRLWQPREIRMRIRNAEHRYMDRNSRSLGQCDDFNWQISQSVKLLNFFNAVYTGSQRVIQNSFIFCNDFPKRSFKKFFIKIIDQICFDKTLQTEHDYLIPPPNPAHPRRKIGYGFCHPFRKHLRVHRFIIINQQHWICLIHNQTPLSFHLFS